MITLIIVLIILVIIVLVVLDEKKPQQRKKRRVVIKSWWDRKKRYVCQEKDETGRWKTIVKFSDPDSDGVICIEEMIFDTKKEAEKYINSLKFL